MYVSTKPASVSSLFISISSLDLIATLILLLITHVAAITVPTMRAAQAGTSTAGSTVMRSAPSSEIAGDVKGNN